MSAPHLIDANVLVALTFTDHEHHERARVWASTVETVAVCPVVEGALVRFLVRTGQPHATATAVLAALHASPRCEFWTDDLSYRDVEVSHVSGHRQVTDAYLASLAAHHDAKLATFDRGLAQAMPGRAALIP